MGAACPDVTPSSDDASVLSSADFEDFFRVRIDVGSTVTISPSVTRCEGKGIYFGGYRKSRDVRERKAIAESRSTIQFEVSSDNPLNRTYRLSVDSNLAVSNELTSSIDTGRKV